VSGFSLRPLVEADREEPATGSHMGSTSCVVSTCQAMSLKDACLSPDVAICATLWSVPDGYTEVFRASVRQKGLPAHFWAVFRLLWNWPVFSHGPAE